MSENAPNTLDQEAIKRLIEATIAAAGDQDPAALPHLIRRQLQGQVSGNLNLDDLIKQVMRQRRSS